MELIIHSISSGKVNFSLSGTETEISDARSYMHLLSQTGYRSEKDRISYSPETERELMIKVPESHEAFMAFGMSMENLFSEYSTEKILSMYGKYKKLMEKKKETILKKREEAQRKLEEEKELLAKAEWEQMQKEKKKKEPQPLPDDPITPLFEDFDE